MTTPIPTSKSGTVSALPIEWPGLEEMARLAHAYFTALPGAEPSLASAETPVSTATMLAADHVAPEVPFSLVNPEVVPALEDARASPSSELPPGTLSASTPPSSPAAAWPAGSVPQAAPTTAQALTASPAYYFLSFVPEARVPSAEVAAPALSVAIPGVPEFLRVLNGEAPARHREVIPADRAGTEVFAGTAISPLNLSRHPAFDVGAIRRDFPILGERVNGRPLVWLDNAATTQKPRAVIERLEYFYTHENSNIHRGAHTLAARATDAYEEARAKVARFLGAAGQDEIVFVRGATEAINLVAKSWGRQTIGQGDEIVLSCLEHHANIVPWQQLCTEVGARLRVVPVDDHGQILLDEYQRLLNGRTRLVAVSQVSNALGTITPIRAMIEMAHRVGARVLVDGAQSVSHLRVDVQALDADFFVFSGHKIFGPTGIGVMYGKRALLDAAPPWQGGGNMIADVTFERTVYQRAPARFEAGTGNIADAVGLGAALDYVQRIGIENIARYEHELLEYATAGLIAIPGLRLIGTAPDKASVLSFVLAGCRTEDVGRALNEQGIAVRAGHHCAQPILRRFGVESTVRPSLAFYNTREEIDLLVATVSAIAQRHRTR